MLQCNTFQLIYLKCQQSSSVFDQVTAVDKNPTEPTVAGFISADLIIIISQLQHHLKAVNRRQPVDELNAGMICFSATDLKTKSR